MKSLGRGMGFVLIMVSSLAYGVNSTYVRSQNGALASGRNITSLTPTQRLAAPYAINSLAAVKENNGFSLRGLDVALGSFVAPGNFFSTTAASNVRNEAPATTTATVPVARMVLSSGGGNCTWDSGNNQGDATFTLTDLPFTEDCGVTDGYGITTECIAYWGVFSSTSSCGTSSANNENFSGSGPYTVNYYIPSNSVMCAWVHRVSHQSNEYDGMSVTTLSYMEQKQDTQVAYCSCGTSSCSGGSTWGALKH